MHKRRRLTFTLGSIGGLLILAVIVDFSSTYDMVLLGVATIVVGVLNFWPSWR